VAGQDIIERARTQVGNLAHALKTPLAVITNEAREDKGLLGVKVAEQATIMRDQMNHYLDRARVAARVGVIGRMTPVLPVVEPLARALERIHRDRDIHITVNCDQDLKFAGEKQDLEEMLGNLCDNACKWAKRNVTVTVTHRPEFGKLTGGRLLIHVDDDGPGLSEKQRARIGRRGVRLDESKPGSGLGLSIVLDLVHSYVGKFELAASEEGGLSARLDLPAA
jgi:signal transduction histidine kinase